MARKRLSGERLAVGWPVRGKLFPNGGGPPGIDVMSPPDPYRRGRPPPGGRFARVRVPLKAHSVAGARRLLPRRALSRMRRPCRRRSPRQAGPPVGSTAGAPPIAFTMPPCAQTVPDYPSKGWTPGPTVRAPPGANREPPQAPGAHPPGPLRPRPPALSVSQRAPRQLAGRPSAPASANPSPLPAFLPPPSSAPCPSPLDQLAGTLRRGRRPGSQPRAAAQPYASRKHTAPLQAPGAAGRVDGEVCQQI